jgi:hypothetical protein
MSTNTNEDVGGAQVEMGMKEDERSRYWAGHITKIPAHMSAEGNISGLKAVLLEEPDPSLSLDAVLNVWAKEHGREFNIVEMHFLPGEPRAVMLLISKVMGAEERKELWETAEAVQAFVSQYRAKLRELEVQKETAEDEFQARQEEENRKQDLETARLLELGRQHEANCGKKRGKKS